jgi:cytochrome c-type biogenesis protein CcmE
MAETAIGGPRAAGALGGVRARRGGKRWQLAIVVLVILGAVGYLVYNGLRTNVYYQTVSELQASGGENGRQVRLAGTVVEGSIVREEGSNTVRFNVADTGGNLPVVYNGVVPDIFAPGIEVVVEGKYRPDTGFVADTMLAKCPSKFDAAAQK